MSTRTRALVASKPIGEFEPGEFHSHVSQMYHVQVKRATPGAKPKSPVPGLNVRRLKSGKLSITRTKARTFAYVTMPEVTALAEFAKCSQADLWNEFKAREFILGRDRMTCEQFYAELKEMPF